jgi:uncharacterized protein (DUF952 family)
VLIYKILQPDEWERFEASGRFDGSDFDIESGFVHCCSEDQLPATLRRFFTDGPSLVVLAVDVRSLGDMVRWEAAPDGERFPHVYGCIPRTAVVSVQTLPGPTQVGEGRHEGP